MDSGTRNIVHKTVIVQELVIPVEQLKKMFHDKNTEDFGLIAL